ncbi:MAG: M24 family metallopeptidase, partial [Clostridia bacterium]
HGEYLKYTKIFKNIYKKYNKKLTIKSSEKVIYSLLQEKSEDEILKLKNLCNITENIFIKSFKKIQVGMSEIDIYNKIRECFNDVTKKYIKDNINSTDIIYFDYSWKNCPIVLTGENLIKGGHTLPTDKLLKFGDTIYIDFGICATYKNGSKLYTDLQRMGYALNIKEKVVPSHVQKVFNTLVDSIEESLDYIKPCVKGYKIDDIVRNYILNKGYPNYNHATGHPVGNKVHDVGAVITNKLQKRSSIELVKNGVYTIEPRIAIQNGGSIEEMIQVTDFGGIPISNIQKKLYVI